MSFFPLFFIICILIWLFFEEDEDANLESAADLNLPKDENKAGGNSDQAMPSLDDQNPANLTCNER